ncbi:DUF1217 domain-containing protein [Paralimibaculum aggregatum]|uniref:DUF1217 domain-containing protein n=1 Tax=Paralimibaculum aggregatum TaxID=3036245 RepID=A0ABQ6LMV6_9RHOB|nr:DUF1217 domain-containing protein [Limibaculum sp. NKW23]GMG83630.1 DUF1217 domain-containing protein [Limibaculum sp. NKW23]
MTGFAPIVPLGGLAGFRFIEQTHDRQLALFERSPEIRRDIAHFEENAGQVETLEDLMADRRLLRVVLGAFGLEEDLDKRAYVRKVIEEGSLDPRSFANRIADPAYRALAEELGFGDLGNRLILTSVRERIIEQYRLRRFESAVGEQDVDLRVAMNFRREIGGIAGSETAGSSGWLRILGSQPMRRVVEYAFNLPDQFALIDIDQQVLELERLSRARYGSESPAVFSDPETVEDALNRFLVRAQIESGSAGTGTGGASAAVQILRAGGLGSAAAAGLFASNLL